MDDLSIATGTGFGFRDSGGQRESPSRVKQVNCPRFPSCRQDLKRHRRTMAAVGAWKSLWSGSPILNWFRQRRTASHDSLSLAPSDSGSSGPRLSQWPVLESDRGSRKKPVGHAKSMQRLSLSSCCIQPQRASILRWGRTSRSRPTHGQRRSRDRSRPLDGRLAPATRSRFVPEEVRDLYQHCRHPSFLTSTRAGEASSGPSTPIAAHGRAGRLG